MQNDHDLLIKLNENVGTLVRDVSELKKDVKALKEDTSNRVDALEREKLDKDEAYRLKKEADDTHTDFEQRLRTQSDFINNLKGRYAVIAVLVMTAIGIGSSLIIYAITK